MSPHYEPGKTTPQRELGSQSPPSLDTLGEEDIPESRDRRRLETRLMHQYLTVTGPLIGVDDRSRPAFAALVPRYSLESDAVLYSMYSLAALHSFIGNVDLSFDAMYVHRKYLAMGVREQKKAVADFNLQTLEMICLTSHLLRICSFATLQIRRREPYRPPMEWLMINGTTAALYDKASPMVMEDPQSLTAQMMRLSPVIYDDEERFGAAYRVGWEQLLERDVDDLISEPWDPEIQEAYESTVSFIGGASAAMKSFDSQFGLGEARRRLILFPVFIKKRFADLVQEMQPRALVVLAHYFAFLTIAEDLWWVGSTGREELQAIAGQLSGKWLDMIEFPLQMIEGEPTYH
ncbi:Zn(2)-C6 fungal-type transcription factor afumD-like protein [Cladobotryum mycophilum]|uniref:Zn(2)-C6 fungal-type transcription factor afumD-like protein n=1 Tax=Cladobotryum mycophilum TaxID=491253 RepID=A0ABR0SPB7_9HYPO